MAQVFSGVRKDVAAVLAAAVGGVALTACSSGGTDYRPAPRYATQPQHACGGQPAPTYSQPTYAQPTYTQPAPYPAPAPAPRPQGSCGARCG